VRLLCVPFFVALLLGHRNATLDAASAAIVDGYRLAALAVFVFAAATDSIDGWLARHLHQRTALGTVLDPIADKLLITAGILGISLPIGLAYRFPLWFPLVVISRDVLITLGAVLVFMLRGSLEIKPNRLGKFSTASQMACVVCALIQVPAPYLSILLAVTVAATVVSGLQYVYRGLQLLHDEHPNPETQCTA
jgi:cardiolipin synthase